MPESELPEGARWTFYDVWEAFPLRNILAEDGLLGEVSISLKALDGGTHGEFMIRWYDLNPPAAKLEVFEDGWEALRLSEIVELLSPLDGTHPTQAEIMDLLRVHGFEDRTAQLKGKGGPEICTCCKGKGYFFPSLERAREDA